MCSDLLENTINRTLVKNIEQKYFQENLISQQNGVATIACT